MNTGSLSHIYAKKQIQTSWIDDPFDLKGAFTGLNNMNHKRNLSNYAEELVAHYAKYECEQYSLHIEDLPPEYQNELARLYIESLGREIEYACYGLDESINSNYLCALLAMLKNDCNKTREQFSNVTRKNILNYYNKSLQEIIDEACDIYLHNIMNENGYYSSQNISNGDFIWSKS